MADDHNLLTPGQFLEQRGQRPALSELERLVALLRGPQGCPWDQKQGALEMLDHLIDEAHELKAALAKGAWEEAEEELGDLLFTAEFVRQAVPSEIAPERAAEKLLEKMVRRHPHVFGEERTGSSAEVPGLWEKRKAQENPEGSRRLDHGLPASLPPLRRAEKVLTRAESRGFVYGSSERAWAKFEEELVELQESAGEGDPVRLEAEFGDALLALLTWGRMHGLSAGRALEGTTARLVGRIEKMQDLAGVDLERIPHSEMRGFYRRVKAEEGTPREVFLNYCGVSPWPDSVSAAVHRAARRLSREGLAASLALREEREKTRTDILHLVGGERQQVVFVPNVSTAALSVAYSLKWRGGAKILLGRSEFPANTVPWRLAAEQFGLGVLWFDEDLLRREPDRGWSELRRILEAERPQLMAFSAVSFWSGFRLEPGRLAELGRASQTLVYVDGIQAIGAVPWQLEEGIDALAGGSHKALQAPEGAGFVIASSRLQHCWVPRLGSWLSLPDPVDFLLDGKADTVPNDRNPREDDPSVLEGGSVNSLGYAGLSAAVRERLAVPPERVMERYLPLQDELEAGLESMGWSSLRAARVENRSSILSFDPPPGVQVCSVAAYLREHGLSCGTPNGRLRFGFHWQNDRGDVTRTLDLMRKLPKK